MIDTTGVPCGEARVVNLCATLFRPKEAMPRYKLSGYDADQQVEDDSYLDACMEVQCRGKLGCSLFWYFLDTGDVNLTGL